MTDKIKNIVVTVLFVGIIIAVCGINIIKKDTLISVSERRKLEQLPKLSQKSVFDGTYFKKLDSYTTDQFIYRDMFRRLKVYTELKVFNKSDYNKLYEYEGYVINETYPLNENSVKYLARKVNEIYTRYLNGTNNIYFTIVPDKNYFVDDGNLKLDYAKMESMLVSSLNYAKYIDIMDTLVLSDYYKTDTHWKQENLVKVAGKILNAMGISMNTEFTQKEVTDFNGVYSGQFPITNEQDKIYVLTNNVLENMTVYNHETKTTSDVYNMDKMSSMDKYDIYLSGAVSLLEINNKMSDTGKELIVFRDSFGSSLVPLLCEEYSKVWVVDTRYISPKILGEYIDFTEKDVLFMYSTLVMNESTGLK